MPTDDRAKLEALPAFDDPHVQIVYRILCDTDLVPPPDEHWEGFTARHVVAAIASAQAASAEPALFIERGDLDRLTAVGAEHQATFVSNYHSVNFDTPLYTTPAPAVAPAAVTEAEKVSGMICQPDGLKFDAFGEPRKRYVRVTLDGSHCVMRPSEGDTYVKDARESGDESPYVVADVWLSEREFDDLGEFNGF